MRFQIQPLDSPDWAIAPEDFAERLSERWPDARVALVPESPFVSLYFQLGADRRSTLVGQYPRTGDALWIEAGSGRQIGELAQWYLELVPPGRRMVLADECVASIIELLPGMGAAEITREFDSTAWALPPWAG
jgi:hypothetical protein